MRHADDRDEPTGTARADSATETTDPTTRHAHRTPDALRSPTTGTKTARQTPWQAPGKFKDSLVGPLPTSLRTTARDIRGSRRSETLLDPQLVKQMNTHLENYLRSWGPVSWETLHTATFTPDQQLARLYTALADIEDDSGYMAVKLRHGGVMRHTVLQDFFTVWSAEEAEHSRALRFISHQYGSTSMPRRHTTLARDPRSIAALMSLRLSRIDHRGLVGSYLALGMVQEYIAISLYRGLKTTAESQALASVMTDIIAQEGRHMRFYRSCLMDLIETHPDTVASIRRNLSLFWRPPGIDLHGLATWTGVFAPIASTDVVSDKLEGLDRLVDRIPGLEGLHLMRSFLDDNPEIGGRNVTATRGSDRSDVRRSSAAARLAVVAR